ncbi:MAG: class I SAM-dependent methyltransferase [Nitrospirae bacterium]|nr:class I SAM-dependent methyltransferase [Nitrospirota bacterium]
MKLTLLAERVRFGRMADVYMCGDCGLVFLDQGSFSLPADFYEKQYHQTYITHIEPAAFNPREYYEKMKKAARPWAEKFAKGLSGGEVVLDLGCSTGHFIDMIKDRAGKVYGHDLNAAEVEFCRDVLGFDVSDKPLNERFKEHTFDYITLIFVLEHIAQPREFLKMLKTFLKPGGKLVIVVPNIQDALVSFYDIPEFLEFYYCIEHLYYYSPTTIGRLLSESGFRVDTMEVIQEYPIANHINWAYRRAPGDVLAARSGLPDVPLSQSAPVEKWKELWDTINLRYQEFLKENGFGDRIWCTASSVC